MNEQLHLINDIPMPKPQIKIRGKYQQWKYENNYRKADSDKRCKNCKNCVAMTNGYRTFYKCNIMGISNSEATDIMLSNVCNYFKADKKVELQADLGAKIKKDCVKFFRDKYYEENAEKNYYQFLKDFRYYALDIFFEEYNKSEKRHIIKNGDTFRIETDEEFRDRIIKKIKLKADLEHFKEIEKTRELNSFEKGIKEEIERLLKEELQ